MQRKSVCLQAVDPDLNLGAVGVFADSSADRGGRLLDYIEPCAQDLGIVWGTHRDVVVALYPAHRTGAARVLLWRRQGERETIEGGGDGVDAARQLIRPVGAWRGCGQAHRVGRMETGIDCSEDGPQDQGADDDSKPLQRASPLLTRRHGDGLPQKDGGPRRPALCRCARVRRSRNRCWPQPS